MSAHVLFNLLNELGKEIQCEACRAFYLFFAASLINSINKSTNVRFYLSYGIKITLKSHFCCKTLHFWHYVRNVVMNVIAFPVNL